MQKHIAALKHQALIFLLKVRAPLVRLLVPKSSYILLTPPFTKNTAPISKSFGFDRGTPVDRYYIESFLKSHQSDIKGRCLEIHDVDYIKKFGGTKVTKAEALDIDTANKQADLYGDLRHLDSIKENTYDCLVITQTFGMIDEYQDAIKECYRILKPKGVLLGTATSFAPMSNPKYSFWRFTPSGMKYALSKVFQPSQVEVVSYGNCLTGQASWVGLAVEELTPAELDTKDEHFPLLVGFRAQK